MLEWGHERDRQKIDRQAGRQVGSREEDQETRKEREAREKQ